MSAISNVEILPANRAKTTAVRLAQGAHGHLQNRVFTKKGFKINVTIFRQEQARLADPFLRKGIHLCELPGKRRYESSQASGALQRGIAVKLPYQQQPLGRTSHLEDARKILHPKIILEANGG
jgi:hypothetical protein